MCTCFSFKESSMYYVCTCIIKLNKHLENLKFLCSVYLTYFVNNITIMKTHTDEKLSGIQQK